MTLEELWAALPLPVAMWARHMIQIHWSEETKTGGVYLAPDGYHLLVNEGFAKKKTVATFLLHELAHIFRGDCLRDSEHPKVMNRAADCIINHNLSAADTEEMNGLQYIPYAKYLNLPTNYLVSTRVLYDAMVRAGESVQSGSGCMFGEVGMRGNKQDCETAHADTILSARGEIAKELEKALGRKLDIGGLQAGTARSTGYRVKAPDPLPLALPEQIIRKLKSVTGGAQRVRNWKRPGRVPMLRGSSYAPRYKLLVAVDVSGSCTATWPVLGGACTYLRNHHALDICVFDTRAVKTKSLTNLPVFGGGTLIMPVFELFSQGKYDALIVLTDGELFDWPVTNKLPAAPIIWVVINGSLGCVQLRGGDAMIPISTNAS